LSLVQIWKTPTITKKLMTKTQDDKSALMRGSPNCAIQYGTVEIAANTMTVVSVMNPTTNKIKLDRLTFL
ncbi:MAG: hypothetical protein AAFY41_14345, partial [Bacteroidota bacterium]